MSLLPLILGSAVGVPLGLIGAGGSIMAVPILVYGLAVSPHDAVGISLCTVGATAGVGAVSRLREGQTDLPSVLTLAGGGVLGTPLGAWINVRTPERFLLGLFGLLMFVVALRMIRGSAGKATGHDAPSVNRWLLLVVGMATGLLAGLFGIGGGFLIVPSLVIVAGLGMRQAVATSLAVIAIISTSGILSFLQLRTGFDLELAGMFAAGSLAGLSAGSLLARRISAGWLQRAFALVVFTVGLFLTVRSLFPHLRL